MWRVHTKDVIKYNVLAFLHLLVSQQMRRYQEQVSRTDASPSSGAVFRILLMTHDTVPLTKTHKSL